MASVKWSATALRELTTLDHVVGTRIVEKVTWLGENFDTIIPEPLHYKLGGLYKLRVGDYRAIYKFRLGVISIETVRHRRDAYR